MSTRRLLFRKLYLPLAFFTLSLCMFALAAFAVSEPSALPDLENENGDHPFTGDRRPGILEPPSDIPTGENAHLYDFLKSSLSGESLDEDSVTTSASSTTEPTP